MIVRPMLIETSLAPGETHTELVEIQNSTEDDLVVQISKIDFSISKDGDLQLLEAGISPSSLDDWLSLPTTELVVKRGKTEKLRVCISAPKEASQLCRWGGLLIESVTTTSTRGMTVRVRFGVIILQTDPMGLDKSGKVETMKAEVHESIEEVESEGGSSRAVAISTTFSNTCLNILKADVRFEVRNMTGDTIITHVIRNKVILPGHKRIFTATFAANDWLPGQYIALAIIDYGGETLVGGQWPFEIPEAE